MGDAELQNQIALLRSAVEDLDNTMESVDANVTILDSSLTNIYDRVGETNTKIDELNARVGDPTAAGTKSSLLEALGDESTDHTVIKELEDVDSTLGTTNTTLETLNTRIGDPSAEGTKASVLVAIGDELTDHTVIKELEDLDATMQVVDGNITVLDTSVQSVDSSIGDTNTRLDTLNTRIGDPADPGTKNSLLEAFGDELTDHTVIKELEDLDATMQVVDGNIQVLDTSINTVDGTLTGTIDPSLSTLDTSVNNLKTSVDTLSSKMTTPSNTSEVVTGYAAKFGVHLIGDTDDLPALTSVGPLDFDGEDFFVCESSGSTVYKFKPGDAAAVSWATIPDSEEGYAIAWDSGNNELVVAQEPTALENADTETKVYVFDSAGTHDRTVTPYNPVPAPTALNIRALAYDSTNSKVYVIYWEANYDTEVFVSRIGELNTTTGEITNYFDVEWTVARHAVDATVIGDGGLLITYLDDTVYKLVGFSFSAQVPRFEADLHSNSFHFFEYDSGKESFYFWDGSTNYFHICALVFVQRVSQFGDWTVDVNDITGTVSLPTGAATSTNQSTIITALQKIDDVQGALRSQSSDVLISQIEEAPSMATGNTGISDAEAEIVSSRADRKGLLVQNVDTSETVWIGPSGVTTSTGIELLPKQSVVLNHYTGSTASIYGICDTGKTANVRYMEAF